MSNKSLSRRILFRMLSTMALYTIAGVGVFFVAVLLYNTRIWDGSEPLYRIVHWFDEQIVLVAVLYFGVGNIIIFLAHWRKPFLYLDQILKATELLYQDNDRLVELPEELGEVEMQMNQIKMQNQTNRQVAKEAEQRKNDLVVYLAHDLKTPLTSVIGYLSLLRDEQQISEELREKYLSISLEKAEHLEDLINEFFEITRFNLSNLTLEYSRVNLTRMLEQLVSEFAPMFQEKNLTCNLQAPPDFMLKCDVGKMQRVFDNLLRNAVNYSFDNSEIQIVVTPADGWVGLRFANQGNTIPREKLNRVFEQFYRLDTARTSSSGGAGLGLAIAKEIVELHKGSIGVESQNDTVIFDVRLPVL